MVPPGPLADDSTALSATKQRLMEKWLAGTTAVRRPTVPRRPHHDTAQLSFAQERLWFLAQLTPDSPHLNMVEAIRLAGRLDPDALREALTEITERHEALRTVFRVHEGEPRQVVLSAREQPPAFAVDAETLSEEAAVERLRTESQRPFELTRGPLIRYLLTPLGPDDHVLTVTMHHLVGDGISVGILFRELFALYAARTGGQAAKPAELPVQYTDFAEWQRDRLRGEELERRLAHWRQTLREPLPDLRGLVDRQRTAAPTLRAVSRRFTLSAEVSQGLRELGRSREATLFMVLLAGFQTVMARRTGHPDVVTGSAVHGRDLPETENLIGFFANTLALRTDLSGDPAFTEALDRVRRTCLDAYAHQDTPIEVLAAELRPGRNGGHNPLFQSALVGESPAGADAMGELEVSAFDFGLDTSEFDLVLHYWETDGRIEGGLRAAEDLFLPESVDRLGGELERLFAAVVEDPARPLSALLPDAASAPVPSAEPAAATGPEPAADSAALTRTEQIVAGVWREVLGVRDVEPDEDFFDVGGHSLRAVRVLLRLRDRVGVDLPVQAFFDAPTISGLAQTLDRARGQSAAPAPADQAHDGHDGHDGQEGDAADGARVAELLRADAVLDAEISAEGAAPADPARLAAPEHILLTGATSFLGAHLLAQLLARTGARVHCLVDAESPGEADRALAEALERYGVAAKTPLDRVTVLPGSLREPLLGLGPIAFARLAGTVDVIHHVGVDAHLALPYERLKAANADSVTEVLRLAVRERVKPVHHVSSAGVLFRRGEAPGPLAEDGRIPAESLLPSGYVRSRWVAEERLRAARERGVPVSVYRPGRLAGSAATGAGDPDSPFWQFVGACVRVGAYPDFGPGADFDLVPVDYAARALAELSLRPDSGLGGYYHLAHPDRTSFAALVERLRARGHRLAATDQEEWSQLVAADALDGADGESATASVAALAGTSRGMPGFGSLRLEVAGTLAALAATDVRCPPVDGPLLDRYLDHLVTAGLLTPPSGAPHSRSENTHECR
ncbi:thioester reductase domain-containing protein [Streptomyces sp. NPDC051907]|uniref:thioester reductase domain-containing protein n=1 Tax=Streptomyces sp. NPDC051907 TaxID=3155284 RepID=UPI00341C9239